MTVTAKKDSGVVKSIFELGGVPSEPSYTPYQMWIYENKIKTPTIHTAAQFVIDIQNDWNSYWQQTIKNSLPELQRIANGEDLRIIQKTISIYTENYQSDEKAIVE